MRPTCFLPTNFSDSVEREPSPFHGVQVCVYTTKDANQRDEDMQKWTEALQERRYFVCANIDYLSSETYDKVEQKSYQYINGDDDYICRGSAFISPDNFKWRFGGWEEKND